MNVDKYTIISAFSAPALIVLAAIWSGMRATEGWGAIAAGIMLLFAFIAALVTGITLFFLRKRQLTWWHGLLISIGGIVVAIGVIMLIAASGR